MNIICRISADPISYSPYFRAKKEPCNYGAIKSAYDQFIISCFCIRLKPRFLLKTIPTKVMSPDGDVLRSMLYRKERQKNEAINYTTFPKQKQIIPITNQGCFMKRCIETSSAKKEALRPLRYRKPFYSIMCKWLK